MNIELLLNEEIESEFEVLKGMNLGTEDYKITVEGLTKLIDRSIELGKMKIDHEEKEQRLKNELEKFEKEYNEKIESRKNDECLRLKQLKSEQINQWIRDGVSVLGIVVPSGVAIWGVLKSLKFEEFGSITTMAGRGFFNKLFRI